MDGRRMNQIFQTVTARLKTGKKGPPESYSQEEKEYYKSLEESILENRKNGFTGTYSFPNDYN